ncbi:MAG: DUF4153 domain-containing protein [Clostridium sp. SCN 57-10]|nr:MAG: DUF4153 domain-containing protein [Clostridium sp. SCN 57-10]
MNALTQSISNMIKGSLKALSAFPASIGAAVGLALVTLIRIQLDWPVLQPWNFLLDCLQLALATGAIFSLAAITAAQSRFGNRKAFLGANLLGAGSAVVTFLVLYLFSGTSAGGTQRAALSSLIVLRVFVVIFVSLVAFILLMDRSKENDDFAESFFMTHKAFFIALIYGLVLLAGTAGIARAVQSLLYREMSGKVYGYLATLVGLLTFTIFVGYFPDFKKGSEDDRREIAQKQPRFIVILFGYIMVPIVLALTAVLLIWAGKTVLGGTEVSFVRLSAISAAYTIGGLWLHAMLARHDSGVARVYRVVYPAASIVILLFEAWALVGQLRVSGLKVTEYAFLLVWALAAAGSVLLLTRKRDPHRIIAIIVCVLAVVYVLPFVGYRDLPVYAQSKRLEKLLVGEHMLAEGKITPASAEPSLDVRIAVTDAVSYLLRADDAKLPSWFPRDLDSESEFKAKLGFEKTWPGSEVPKMYLSTNLYMPATAIDVDAYRWAVSLHDAYGKESNSVTLQGDKGLYQIDWILSGNGVPTVRIMLDGRMIVEQSMDVYLQDVVSKYPPAESFSTEAPLADMSVKLDTPEIKALLVFDSVSVNVNTESNSTDYWMSLRSIYFSENP